jgi:hypothetical protein
LRLNHLLLSPELAKRLVDTGVDRNLRGQRCHINDHCPTWSALSDEPAKQMRAHRATKLNVSRHVMPFCMVLKPVTENSADEA